MNKIILIVILLIFQILNIIKAEISDVAKEKGKY